MSPLLRLYLAATWISGPLWRLAHRRRLKQGKEDAARLPEKYGEPPAPRPQGQVLWFHALSVGEALALLPLIERALEERSDRHVVLTTSTVTSATALSRAGLPERVRHVFLPIDTPRAVRRFLDHWRPALAAFAELDFWPRLMVETHRGGIPMALVNARLPEGNFESRRRLGAMMADILGLFDLMLLQDAASFERFRSLGADGGKMRVVGPLKAAARPLPTDKAALSQMRTRLEHRPVWLAAATHRSEHSAILDAHAAVLQRVPDALLIVAPRHVADGAPLAETATARGMSAKLRSHGEMPEGCAIYVADTIGEMGLWYRLSPIGFVGHSLGSGDLSGKNPYEAAALGSVILHGPEFSYFADSYATLARHGASLEVATADALAEAVVRLFDPRERAPMLDGVSGALREGQVILENSWTSLRGLID